MKIDPSIEKEFAVVLCKDCGCPIVWARNGETGKMIPFDARTQVWWIAPSQGTDPAATKVPKFADGKGMMVSHFATCPGAAKFSGKNRGGTE
jgi:hypothetical protein